MYEENVELRHSFAQHKTQTPSYANALTSPLTVRYSFPFVCSFRDMWCVLCPLKKKHQDRVQSKIRFHHIQNPTHLNTCSWDSTLQTYPHRYSHKSKLNYDHNLGSWRWGIICANRTSAIHCFSLVPRI